MKRQRHSTCATPWKLWLSCWILLQSSSNTITFTEARTHNTIVDDNTQVVAQQLPILSSEAFSFQSAVDAAYDVASIDQDLKQIGQLLRNGDFDGARSLYEDGSHSTSYAHVFLNEPLQQELPAGSVVTGPANDGEGTAITGIVHETVPAGERELKIRYVFDSSPTGITSRAGSTVPTTATATADLTTRSASKQSLIKSKVNKVQFSEKSKRHRDDRNGVDTTDSSQAAAVVVNKDHNCYVGGSPEPVTEGCFKEYGTLTIDALGTDYFYSYDVLNGNHNARSISKLSSRQADDSGFQMLSKEFFQFTNYFGREDYADHLIQTAFDAVIDPTVTTALERSNLHFFQFNDDALASFLYTLMGHMTLWMETVVHLDAAIEICGDPSERHVAIQQWSDTAALYLGSRGTRRGILHHELAAKQCQVFQTCAPDRFEVRDSTFQYEEGEAHINEQVTEEFELGRQQLLEGDCAAVKARKAKIVRLMTIPLLQATLLEAFKVDHYGDDNYIMGPDANAIAYGLTILPLVNACNEDDATELFDALGNLHTPASFWARESGNNLHNEPLSFLRVKQTLEKSYSCMKIKCSDVGGIWNFTSNQYMNGAEPCGENDEEDYGEPPSINAATSGTESNEDGEVGFFAFLMTLLLAGLLVFGLTVRRFTKQRRETKRSIESNRNLHSQTWNYWDEREIEVTID